MKLIEIKSRPGTFVKLDADVAKKIGRWGWSMRPSGYVYAHLPKSGGNVKGGTGKNILLSRAVIWAVTGQWPDKSMVVDHFHHDKLDNRVRNLRVVPQSLNCRNRKITARIDKKFRGVYTYGKNSGFRAILCIRIKGKPISLYGATTQDEDIAAMCYDCMAHKAGGFVFFNFPDIPFKEKWQKIGVPQRNQITKWLKRINIETDKGMK